MSWRVLPSATQIEICGFLDAAELGLLEICGRRSVDDAARAWTIMAARIAGGHLANLPPKKRVAAHARARALIPSTPEENNAMAGYEFAAFNDMASFEELNFTVAVAWGREGDYQTATFPYLSLTTASMGGEFSQISSYRLLAEPAGSGHETIAPYLRDAESLIDNDGSRHDEAERFFNEWAPKAYLICTRKSDGAAIRVAAFTPPVVYDHGFDRFGVGSTHSISFEPGRFLVADDAISHYMTLHAIYDEGTGRVRAFCSTIWKEDDDSTTAMSSAWLCALLHARLDDSISD
jgi:hypothetical protein